jgi:hypothetical protein
MVGEEVRMRQDQRRKGLSWAAVTASQPAPCMQSRKATLLDSSICTMPRIASIPYPTRTPANSAPNLHAWHPLSVHKDQMQNKKPHHHSTPPPRPTTYRPTTVFKLNPSRNPARSSFFTSTTQWSKLSILTRAFVSSTTSVKASPNRFRP